MSPDPSTALTPRRPVCTSPRGRGRGGILERIRAGRAERNYQQEVSRYVNAVTWEFRDACEGLGIVQRVDTPTGPLARVPKVGRVLVGPPTTVMVELMPGQEPEDITRQGRRLAHSLGFHGLRVEPVALRWVRVVMLDADPLASGFNLPSLVLDTAEALLLLARDETGTTMGHAVTAAIHLAIQGMTRSGKSAFAYGLFAQLAGAPDVLVAGVDHTDLTLGRAWDGTVHRPWQSVGATPDDVRAHVEHVEHLVEVMRGRRDLMGRYEDKITTSVAVPLVLVVFEEFPQLLDLAADIKVKSGETKWAERLSNGLKALVAEGGKYGFRVVLLAQRFEAGVLGDKRGGFIRDQFALRISFAVPEESLCLLHARSKVAELQDDHSTAEAGIAIVSGPGRPLARVRVPHLTGGYREYVERIERHGRRP